MLLGLAYLGKYDTAQAIKQFEQVNQINPKNAAGHYYRARALLARGDGAGARKAYEQALELAPDSKTIRIELASVSGQKPDPALLASYIEDLKAALSRDPANVALRNALVMAYLARNQREEGEAEARRILEHEIGRFQRALRRRAAAPALTELHRLGAALAREEAERALAELGLGSEEKSEIVRRMAERLARRLLYPASRTFQDS